MFPARKAADRRAASARGLAGRRTENRRFCDLPLISDKIG